jgi:tetratricopeptide (TPR) repeat protein
MAGWERSADPRNGMSMQQDPGEHAGRLQERAAELQGRHRWGEAEAMAGRAGALLAAEPDTPALGRTLHALAGTFDDLGDHVRAEALYRRAATILSAPATGGPDDGLRIRCARGLAANLRIQGRIEEADVILVAALALAEQLLGPFDVETLATMTDLGRLCEGVGRLGEAEELYRQALARAEGAGGSDPEGVATIATALSGVLERRSSETLVATNAPPASGY